MTNETTRPLKVFLCHASGDKPAVRDLYKHLIAEGVDAWLDKEKLLPGQDWSAEIHRAVRESDVVVICLSNKSITKEGYVQREIKLALDSADEKPDGTIFLIPARLEDCAVPERLSGRQWVDLFEENGFARLLRSLKLRAAQVGAVIEPSLYGDEDKEIESRVDQLYTEGLAAFWVEDWDKACQRFQAILRERPNHKNAAEKLAEAERRRNFVKLYSQATEAYQSENWPAAIKALEELLEKSADYKDAAHLLKDAKKQKQLRELYIEAKRLHTAQKWQAVIRVFDQIAGIDSSYPDPEGLLPSAQKEAAELKRLADLNALYSQGVHKMDAGEWHEARSLLEQVHKAQTGYLDTERLLRKVENEILKIEETRKRDAQVQMLYEQARKMVRAGQWSKALAQMNEIQKLNNQFVDSDSILEKAKAGVEREEQEAQWRRELAGLYAEAVSLLEAKKYQEALEKWNAVQAIDPKYKDVSRVKSIARRKLDELSRPEVAGKPWLKIASDWLRLESNIPVDREILSEKLLLLSFAGVVIIHVIWGTLSVRLNVWESSPILIFLFLSVIGGLYGAIVAFAFNKTFPNWQLKHSLTLVVGWALGLGIPVTLIIHGDLPGFKVYWYIPLLFVATMKWARPATRLTVLVVIFTMWVLAWEAPGKLLNHLEPLSDSIDTTAFADAFAILLGLLFTFGMQVERSWDILKTAFFGALGFGIGNYFLDIIGPLLAFPVAVAFALWGLIGGAILEAPSRDTRRILFSAGTCGIGLLVGYYVAFDILPEVLGQSYLISFIGKITVPILRQAILGTGLGLAIGFLIRRVSAIAVLTILGAGAYIFTVVLFSRESFEISSIPDAVRGALIGLLLGYGYGYMRKAKPLQTAPHLVITKPVWTGIISFIAIALLFLLSEDIERAAISPPFLKPNLSGYRLDWCLSLGENCGEPAAVEWCKLNGYSGVVSFAGDFSGTTTKVISSGEVCSLTCSSFSFITCQQSQNRLSSLATSFAPSPIASHFWEFENSIQGWGGIYRNISIPKSMNGFLMFDSKSEDPFILSPGNLQIDASTTSVITVRMRILQGQSSEGQIFFVTDKDPHWGELKSVLFFVGKGDNTFQTYDIPMSINPYWKDEITQFRLDPTGRSDAQIAIDYVAVHAR